MAASSSEEGENSPAPVVHVADDHGALLVDYSHGAGRIIILTDPYIVANGGIERRDNLRLATNALTSSGLIAFDEYHQGRGITRNAFVGYFAGTPVLPIAAQIIVFVALVLWTRGRRFGRPLPLKQVDRRSSLSSLWPRCRNYSNGHVRSIWQLKISTQGPGACWRDMRELSTTVHDRL